MSDVAYAVRAAASGEIYRYGRCPANLVSAQAGALEIAEECPADVTDETHYYDGQDYVLRPTFSLSVSALSVPVSTTVTISNIPTGTLVIHPGGSLVVDDGFVDWSALEPGDYEFKFQNFPYIEEAVSVTVTAV